MTRYSMSSSIMVSTHSRPKAAGTSSRRRLSQPKKFQHTAARRRLVVLRMIRIGLRFGFNTQPPEGGWDFFLIGLDKVLMFQHTAARRRLD